jgi:hypothetical protein
VPKLIRPPQARPATAEELLRFVIAYATLLTAALEAREQLRSPRSNPVPIDRLRRRGAGDDVLIWILYQGHCERLAVSPEELTDSNSARLARDNLGLRSNPAFALTESGEDFADRLLMSLLFSEGDEDFTRMWTMLNLGRFTPHYDTEHRVFSWGRQVIKCFRQPSPNQEIILSSAQELSWPDWFDDPLPRRGSTNAKVRLHDTIKDLNRRQQMALVQFKGDGTGTRVGWELR